jgi:hypothetical protein
MLARVESAQRFLLPAVALEHGRVQIQAVSARTFRQPRQLSVSRAREKRWHCPCLNGLNRLRIVSSNFGRRLHFSGMGYLDGSPACRIRRPTVTSNLEISQASNER